ncbi:acyl carrier protein [Mucilaginibacter sp. ZT4R22]|uniref:Acyl carrier protein n=1 Tax=Mucilaginibacter pankratovii TaxID=2772110 RepID=A0ABR7WT53_9SPHI|nr:acyl carrier protein [Mucilaginibacter pankratovii]MBD1365487.1 acyl carrier protein [Mucilaginibacter pankratovii]
MERQQIIAQVTDIFRDVLDNDDITLTDATTARDVEDWDSLNHIQLVVGIEKHFKIRFAAKEIHSWQNVGELVDSVAGKL